MTPLDIAYRIGSEKAVEDFSKVAWAQGVKFLQGAVKNPFATGAAVGGVSGAAAGGEDNRLWGAIAGATAGGLAGRGAVRGFNRGVFQKWKPGAPWRAPPQPGGNALLKDGFKITGQEGSSLLAGQTAALAGGAAIGGIGGGAVMNLMGIGDRPKPSFMPFRRSYGYGY